MSDKSDDKKPAEQPEQVKNSFQIFFEKIGLMKDDSKKSGKKSSAKKQAAKKAPSQPGSAQPGGRPPAGKKAGRDGQSSGEEKQMNAAQRKAAKKAAEKKALEEKRTAEQAALKKKKRRNKMIVGGVLAFIVFLIWYGFQPLRAGIPYGICSTYLEHYIKYPATFRITQYDEYGPSTRVFFTYTDEYGGTRSEMIECILNPDISSGYKMDDILINRISIGDEALQNFNHTIPGILFYEPDLTIPRPAGDDLKSLKRD